MLGCWRLHEEPQLNKIRVCDAALTTLGRATKFWTEIYNLTVIVYSQEKTSVVVSENKIRGETLTKKQEKR